MQIWEGVKRPRLYSDLTKPHATDRVEFIRSGYVNAWIAGEPGANCGHQQYNSTEPCIVKMEVVGEGLFERGSVQ